jgi:hypothetical protein
VLPELHAEFEYLKRFAWTYPYSLESEIRKLKPGTVLVLYGRMLLQEGRYPSQALEVWGVDAATDGAKALPAKDAPPPAGPDAAPGERAALLHWKALQELRSAPADANGRVAPRWRALEALRAAADLYEQALAEKPDDVVLQESHAQNLWVLHTVLSGKWWPK